MSKIGVSKIVSQVSLLISHRKKFNLSKCISNYSILVQVVDVSGATVIAELVPGCRVDFLDNCGHSVVMEKPCRTAKLILEFIILQQNARSGNKKSS